ncbi:MAG: hypothetical protein U9R39_11065 [Campylobacterota bacterium]|nr:hypothetical protein [Campylobacterota bacterium]
MKLLGQIAVILLFSISIIGCSSKETLNKVVKEHKKVYLYVNKNNNPNPNLLNHFENNILFAFKTKDRNIEVISHLYEMKKDGLLLTIDGVQQRGGIKNELLVVYKITNNLTKKVLTSGMIEETSLFGDYIEISIDLSQMLVNEVDQATDKLLLDELKESYKSVANDGNKKEKFRIVF